MKVCVFIADSNGAYPVPAVNGGAVQDLLEYIVQENNKRNLLDLTVVSFYDPKAEKKALDEYQNVDFIWVKIPWIIKWMDSVIFWGVTHFFKRKKSISFRSIASLIFYVVKSSSFLKRNTFPKIVLENNVVMSWIIKLSDYKGDIYYHFHNEPRINAKREDVFSKCTAICVSQYIARQISSKKTAIQSISESSTTVLENCADTVLFKYDRTKRLLTREKYGIKPTDNVIIFVGRFSKEKGLDKLLQAIPLCKTENLKVLLVGSLFFNSAIKDSYHKYLREIARECGDKVIFTGFVPHTDIPDLYNASDISVLPSVWNDPAPLTIIESLACGVPIITTQSGGIPEYVADCGYVLPIDDKLIENIAQKIDELFSDKELMKCYSKKAIYRVNEKYTTSKYFENFVRLIS